MITSKNKLTYILILSFISFSVNFYYGSLGVLSIDTFAFFDSGFRILNGDSPFKDYWTISGPIIDYLQALYFLIFGVNWNSYLLNGSIINLLLTIICFNFFKNFGLDNKYSFFYSVCVSILSNPSMGTPFPDHYSAFFSLLSIICFLHAVKYEKKIYWLLIPVLLFIGFFCKQTPASYIIIFFLINFFLYSYIKKKNNFILQIIYGTSITTFILIIFILINEINIKSFFIQYFFYPRTIGVERISEWKLTFNKGISTFKLIYLIFIPLLLIFFKKLFFNKNYIQKESFLLNFNILSLTILFVIHQWLTLNFIFIFFMIPILCAIVQINLNKTKFIKFIKITLLIFCLMATLKYHLRFNEERKMLDLENVDLSKYIEAEKLSPKLKGLKWITREYSANLNSEIYKLQIFKNTLEEENKKIMFLSNYQFFSAIIKKSLNSPNRWFGTTVARPSKNNPYYNDYLVFNYNILKKKKIEVIYIDKKLGNYHLDLFNEILKKFPNNCKNISIIQDLLIKYDISACYN